MRDLPDPGHAGDDGTAEPGLVAALLAYSTHPESRQTRTLAVLQHARLLVPVVAVLGEVEVDDEPGGTGLTREKTSDMATVLMRGRDGRTALLAFTGTEALHRWDPQARPVPVDVTTAAQAAVQDDAAALVVDVAGPVRFVIETEDLHELAAGHFLVEVDPGSPDGPGGVSARYGWVTPGP